MKMLTPIFVCLLSVNILHAESPEWNSGVVVLQSDEVITGQIAIHETHDVVLLRSEQGVMVLPAYKVKNILFYDVHRDINRKFVVIPQTVNLRLTCRLFEIVLSGNIAVLRRKTGMHSGDEDNIGYEYFLQTVNEVVSIRKFRTRIYPHLIAQSPSVKEFVKENRLNPNLPADIIRIVQNHNDEIESNYLIAGKF